MKNFEDYLKQIHAESYTGTDDDMPDAFEHWLLELDMDDIFKYADLAITDSRIESMNECKRIIITNFAK